MIWQCITGIQHSTMPLPPNHNTSTAVTAPSYIHSSIVVSVMGVVYRSGNSNKHDLDTDHEMETETKQN